MTIDPARLGAHNDTPVYPGTNYRVHGAERPLPPVVTPGTFSTQDAPGRPPSDAVVLFDGTESSLRANWVSNNDAASPVAWRFEPGFVEVVKGAGDIRTRQDLADGQYHVEWTSPTEIVGQHQGRGNSGVFMFGIYEIQVLDNYDNPTYADGTVGGVYGQIPPLANAIRPPGQWNTYDILWNGPVFNGDQLARPARLTLIFNGVCVHHAAELLGNTPYRQLPSYTPHPPRGPLRLQDHGNPVRFRNIWYRPLGKYDAGRPESPVRSAL